MAGWLGNRVQQVELQGCMRALDADRFLSSSASDCAQELNNKAGRSCTAIKCDG